MSERRLNYSERVQKTFKLPPGIVAYLVESAERNGAGCAETDVVIEALKLRMLAGSMVIESPGSTFSIGLTNLATGEVTTVVMLTDPRGLDPAEPIESLPQALSEQDQQTEVTGQEELFS